MRGKLMLAGGAVLLALSSSTVAAKADYPDKPIHIVVSYTPGGTVDLLARALAPYLTKAWGQQIVVENRPGAGGSVGAEYVAAAPGDGYTLLLSTNSPLTTNVVVFKTLNYDPLKDFVPVIVPGENSLVLAVDPRLPVKSVDDLIALAKKEPGRLIGASSGNGSTSHMALAEFEKTAGLDITHVPYKGGVPSLTAVISGEAQLVFADVVPTLPMIRDKRVLALATTGLNRSGVTPDIPTLNELGLKGFSVTAWIAMVAPKGTPQAAVDKLNGTINAILKDPEFRAQIIKIGIDPLGNTPEQFAAFLREQLPIWKQRAVEAGLQPE
ncbi:MAG TPA: tripartite tricarboxylate transporter substrate binding protein [Xanthobacteraceae bacterium]|jgi:tripartite-type tricarboxylate transporter receptor subunit TctC|nr:tripartite tricarboxylate transporter substrate binding protein [Xanthobacteraceae bacterium]